MGMSKSGVAAAVAGENDMKPKVVTGILASLATLVTSEVKKTGKFTIPGVCMVKSRHKPATKEGKTSPYQREGFSSSCLEGAVQMMLELVWPFLRYLSASPCSVGILRQG